MSLSSILFEILWDFKFFDRGIKFYSTKIIKHPQHKRAKRSVNPWYPNDFLIIGETKGPIKVPVPKEKLNHLEIYIVALLKSPSTVSYSEVYDCINGILVTIKLEYATPKKENPININQTLSGKFKKLEVPISKNPIESKA